MLGALAALVLSRAHLPVADLPFEHTPGRIWLAARLNGTLIRATLDTGASVSLADSDLAFANGATKHLAVPAIGPGTGTVPCWVVKGLQLDLVGSEIFQPIDYALPLARARRNANVEPIPAILGGDFLARFVVEIDYRDSRLRLFEPRAYRPERGWRALPLDLSTDTPVLRTALVVRKTRVPSATIMLDTGSSQGLMVTHRGATRHGLVRLAKGRPLSASPGLGGALSVLDGGTASIRLGGHDLRASTKLVLTREGRSGTKAPYDAWLGDSSFNDIAFALDYSRAKIYVRP